MCSLIVALTIIETTMWADAYPTYQAQDDDMNNFKQCHSDVSNKYNNSILLP
jgi:hypothetical protein